MSVQVKIPAVGESISSGVVAVWHKKSGEQVKKGDPLFTLETDKVSTEIVAEADGVLRTKANEGQEVKIVEEEKLDVSKISGKGKGGRVTKGDALAAAQNRGSQDGTASESSAEAEAS